MRNTLTAAAIAAGLLTITACASGGTPTTAAAAGSGSGPSCHAQYESWRHSPAGDKVRNEMKAVQSAGSSDDLPKMTSSLAAAARAVRAMPSAPRCADPAGYWRQIFTRVTAAADNAKSQSGLGGLMLAVVPLKQVPGIEKKLKAELHKTIGTDR